MDRNCKSRHLRQALRDYKVESNGYLNYRDLNLLEDMSGYRIQAVPNSIYCRFIPPDKQLDDEFFKRISSFNWFMKNGVIGIPISVPKNYSSIWATSKPSTVGCLHWSNFQWTNDAGMVYEVEGIFVVPEFINRFGFTSTFAFMINCFRKKYSITRRQHLQLIYVALIQSSQVQFVYIMREMLHPESYDKNQNLFLTFRHICKIHELKCTAGPMPRFQGQPPNMLMEMATPTLESVIEGLEQAVCDMEAGLFINLSKKVIVSGVHLKKYNVKYVGEVAGLSFPSICVFTGLCKSENSMMSAMFARVNDSSANGGSPNSYFDKMNNYLQQFVDPDLGKYDKSYYDIASYAISKSWDEVQCSIENAFCARFRSTHKWEVYCKGFDLYTIFPTSPKVQIKRFGSTTWEVMSVDELC